MLESQKIALILFTMLSIYILKRAHVDKLYDKTLETLLILGAALMVYVLLGGFLGG